MILLFVMILEEKFNEEDILHLYLCMHSCSKIFKNLKIYFSFKKEFYYLLYYEIFNFM